ncbi:MAG: prepilin-type N-terminal cleavage/methylation domain-containing protein [Myxococcota bacterium]
MRVSYYSRPEGENGFTLVELMIVVAIVAIIATVAVPMFMRTVRRAKSAEVPAMFAAIQTSQEGYYSENGEYLTTGSVGTPFPDPPAESQRHPASPAGADTATNISPIPDSWTALRIQSEKTALYCSYVTISGGAGEDSRIGSKGNDFGFLTAPEKDWYYVLAECDFDNDSATNSHYFTSSELDTTLKENEGR